MHRRLVPAHACSAGCLMRAHEVSVWLCMAQCPDFGDSGPPGGPRRADAVLGAQPLCLRSAVAARGPVMVSSAGSAGPVRVVHHAFAASGLDVVGCVWRSCQAQG